MGLSSKSNSNPRLMERINRGFRSHFSHIQHSSLALELKLQKIYIYQAERIKFRTCSIQEFKL